MSAAAAYEPRPVKRRYRRTKAEMEAFKEALYDLAAEHRPVSVRHLFYLAVSRDIVEKTEAAYKSISRITNQMREEREIPWRWFVDATRWMRKPRTHQSLEHLLGEQAELYRRDLWDSQPSYVEIWCESESVAGVIYEVTAEWDVPLYPCRGYGSQSFLRGAAEAIDSVDDDKPVYLYYLGDWDPSGVDIDRDLEARLRRYSYRGFAIERVAVTPEQIDSYQLPSRPPKTSDTRSKNFRGGTVETEALPPEVVRNIVRECIEQHIDPEILVRTQQLEDQERRTLRLMVDPEEEDES